MRHRFSSLVVVVLTAALFACGSSKTSRPADIPQPDIDARLAHEIFFGSQDNAPATINVYIRNRANVPIHVRRMEIDSPGMAQYTILRNNRYYNEVVNAGEEKVIGQVVTVVTTTSRPTEPLQIRAIVEFEAGGTRWREIVMAR
ncbi:MAG: hypothetical protein ACTHQM_13545 [Thermoanaerobaculia bacterium]